MNWFKGLGLVAVLAAALPASGSMTALAETSTGTKSDVSTAKTDDGKGDSKMGEADKRAKAADCSKQADAKKLHGEARKKFRSSCKRGK